MVGQVTIPAEGDTMVSPRFRIVPNGIEGGELRATLLISLQRGTYHSLKTWPSSMAKLLSDTADGEMDLNVLLQPTLSNGICGPVVKAQTVRLAEPKLADAMIKGKDTLSDLWGRSLVGKLTGKAADDVWTHLVKTLDALQKGTATGKLKDAPDGHSAKFGDQGQLEPTEVAQMPTCETVLSTRYSDAALVLERRRGRALVESVKFHGENDSLPVTVPDLGVPDTNVPSVLDIPPGVAEKIRNAAEPLDKIRLLAQFVDPPAIEQPGTEGKTAQQLAEGKAKTFAKVKKDYAEALRKNLETIGDPLGALETWKSATDEELQFGKPGLVQVALEANTDAQLKRRKEARWHTLRAALTSEYANAANEFEKAKKAIFDDCAMEVCKPATREAISAKSDATMLGEVRAASEYGTWSEYADKDEKPPSREMTHASLAFFGIEGNPSLSRVFGLAFDIVVEFPKDELNNDVLNYDYAVICALPAREEPTEQTIWTRTKLRSSGAPHGWPCTTAEYLLWQKGENACLSADFIGQFDGVMAMGGVDNCGMPRFDISSLDVGAALEAERSWLQAVEALGEDKGDAQSRAARAALAVGPDYQSSGLTLLCRSAASDAIRKLAALKVKLADQKVAQQSGGAACTVQQIHDAQDLTSGYRLMVGVPIATEGQSPSQWATNWRPLMRRSTRFGTSGEAAPIVETLLAMMPARVELDGTQLAIAVREMATGAATVETIVNETFAQWDGTPMGVACGRIPGEPAFRQDANCFGRTFDLPSTGERPVYLRNGRPYRLGLKAVFSGGGAVPAMPSEWTPQDDKGADWTSDVRARLYCPSWGQVVATCGDDVQATPFTRSLRHERIGAPTVLLPRGQALRRNGAMGFDSVGKMIVRTMRLEKSDAEYSRQSSRAQPTVSQRIVMVPSIPQANAARHHVERGTRGVFDGILAAGPPPGAYPRLKMGRGRMPGFPVARTETRPGIDGTGYLVGRTIQDAIQPGPDVAPNPSPNVELANAVYAIQPGGGPNTTYFPDPAAETLVIRLRRAGGGERGEVLPGDPVQIVLLPEGDRWPNLQPVLLSLRSQRTRTASEPPRHDNVLSHVWSSQLDPSREGYIRAPEVDLLLAAGDHFEVEMWLVPSAWRLAHDFAVVQAMSHVLSRDNGAGPDCCMAELAKAVAANPALCLKCEDIAGGVRYVGPGGDVMPPTKAILECATRLRCAMLQHPLPEIAAVRRIEAIHAVNRPEGKPSAESLSRDVDPFPGTVESPMDEPLPLRALRPKKLEENVTRSSDAAAICEGSKHLVLSGTVKIDRDLVDALQITARVVSPTSSLFDDPTRRRSLAHRLAGTWPTQLDDSNKLRLARDVFGFKLAPDGRVELLEGEVTLLKIDQMPRPGPREPRDGIDLEPYFRGTGEFAKYVSQRHLFPDGKARRLLVRINALSRSAGMMATAARVVLPGDPWLSGSGIVVEQGELLPSESLPARLVANVSKDIEVVMPATVRPAMPATRAPVPVFETVTENFVSDGKPALLLTRRAATRIPLERGWFDSGEGERLGIVLWPPEQMLADEPGLQGNRVTLRAPPAPESRVPLRAGPCDEARPEPSVSVNHRVVALPDFEDTDLGPGGRYITRRGMDPVRLGADTKPVEKRIFLGKEAFPDLWRHPHDPAAAEFVPYALMPVDDAGGPKPTGEMVVGGNPPLAVGLVTYAPRFDPELEEWYADVLLQPGARADSFVRFGLVRYQPNTRPDLRCSPPVVQWAQPLPERRVELVFDQQAKALLLTVTGMVSAGRALQSEQDGKLREQEKQRSAPIMRLTLYEEGKTQTDAKSRITRELKPRDCEMLDAGDPFRPELRPRSVANGNGIWNATIPVGDALRSLWLQIDEIEYFLPATLPPGQEPMSDDAWKDFDPLWWQASGPRFSVQIELAKLLGGTTQDQLVPSGR